MPFVKEPTSHKEMLVELLECFHDRYTVDNGSTHWMGHYINRIEKVLKHEHTQASSPPAKPKVAKAGPPSIPKIPRHTPRPKSGSASEAPPAVDRSPEDGAKPAIPDSQ